MRLWLAVVAGVGLFPAVAAAQFGPPNFSPPEPAAPEPNRLRFLSATITPLAVPWELYEITHLFPMVALGLEVRAHPNLGLAAMGLIGVNTDTSGGFRSERTVFEIGVEPRAYLQGGFRGWMTGAALHYFRVHIDLVDVMDSSFILPYDFAGYAYGPFFGYKFVANVGFTFEAKAGFEIIDRTMSDAGKRPSVLPITDAKVGWSF